MGRDNDDKWMMLETSAQSYLFYKDEDSSEDSKMVEIGGGFILGKLMIIVKFDRYVYF